MDNQYSAIIDFNLPRLFKSTKGTLIEIVGTGSGRLDQDRFCNHTWDLKSPKPNVICMECYLNLTYDIIRVNGILQPTAYRRGTTLRLAGLKHDALKRICHDHSPISQQTFDLVFDLPGKLLFYAEDSTSTNTLSDDTQTID